MSSSSPSEEIETEIIFQMEEQSSGEDPPMSEWSSLVLSLEAQNTKRLLHSEGLYSPGSGELCGKYIAQSDSEILHHPYYHYPAVDDPGITEAILAPEKPIIYDDNGQDLYLALCAEIKTCPVRSFHRNLLTDEISLSYYGVNPAGVRAMAAALQYNKFVKIFNLTDNFLNDDACYHLGQMLRTNVTLQELNLAGCRIGPTGVIRLADSLHLNKKLITLNLARNYIKEQGGVYYAKEIAKGVTVKRVNLSRNNLGRQTALALAEVFEYKDVITHLDLSMNDFVHIPSTAKMLDSLACGSTRLQELNLAWNSLGGERIAGYIKKIMLIPTLKILDLSHNKFNGEETITVLLSKLIKAKKLVTLDLSSNPFSPSDALIVLEKMLKPGVKLENLLMGNVWVNKKFLLVLDKVKHMKCRKNFVVTFEGVLENWTIQGADAREMVLRRADYLGYLNKRNKVDVALYFLAVNKERDSKPIAVKDMIDRKDADGVPLDDALITELASTFPGPKSAKAKLINLEKLCEYMQRIWPERKLPPTPPPPPPSELDPEPEPIPVPQTKGKPKKT